LAGPFSPMKFLPNKPIVPGEKVGLFTASPRYAPCLRIPVGFSLLSLPGTPDLAFNKAQRFYFQIENWCVFVAYPIPVHPINPDSAFQFVKGGVKDKAQIQ